MRKKKISVELRSFYGIGQRTLFDGLKDYRFPVKSIVTNCAVHKLSNERMKYNDIETSQNRQLCAHKNLNREVIDFGRDVYSIHHKNKFINLVLHTS